MVSRLRAVLQMIRDPWQKTEQHHEAEQRLRAQNERLDSLARRRLLETRLDTMRRDGGA